MTRQNKTNHGVMSSENISALAVIKLIGCESTNIISPSNSAGEHDLTVINVFYKFKFEKNQTSTIHRKGSNNGTHGEESTNLDQDEITARY